MKLNCMIDEDKTLLIVDFEATCDLNERLVPRQKMEIIEIGALKVRLSDFKIVNEFQSFVRPLRTPILTDFCKELTGIKQKEVDEADTFYEVAESFFHWCWDTPCSSAWSSWAMYDYYQLEQDCEHYFVDNELLCVDHYNLKNMYGDAANGRRRGLKNAVQEQGLTFKGKNHRALDDVLNTYSVISQMPKFREALQKKFKRYI